ncbi:hypothetical protein [Streptomyces sp. NPDC008137]|uniref:hypothetical protein n=1 Tax=Streptomyces sp. NPDC008137 TaxID=3364813 RepID=UPI0036ED19E6
MERQQILDLYQWDDGVCFRHPEQGTVPTVCLKTLRPLGAGQHEVRACGDCLIGMEDIRREAARRSGSEYQPGHVGECDV